MKPNFMQDVEGTQYFIQYLRNKGFQNIQTTDQYAAWDIEADWNNHRYYFELKVRPRAAIDGTYDDTICEQYKLIATPDINRSYVVNLFIDKMSIIPYTAPYTIQRKFCQKTNCWDRTKVMKNLVSYKNEEKYLHDYE